MSISSEEVNYLIYRYLHEAGFLHSAFTFGHESLVYKSQLKGNADDYAGLLVSLLHKGLLYFKLEYHLSEDGSSKPCNKPFGLFENHVCGTETTIDPDSDDQRKSPLDPITKPSKKAKNERKKRTEEDLVKKETQNALVEPLADSKRTSKLSIAEPKKNAIPVTPFLESSFEEQISSTQELVVSSPPPEPLQIVSPSTTPDASFKTDPTAIESELDRNMSMDLDFKSEIEIERHHEDVSSMHMTNDSKSKEDPPLFAHKDSKLNAQPLADNSLILKVRTLTHHTKGVFSIAFNHADSSLLASASSDGTAVIWKIDDATDGDTNTDGTSTPIVGILEHVGVENSPIDATTVEWSHSGKFLATGAYDGSVNVWSAQGSPVCKLMYHTRPVFTVRWNPKDTLLLAASFDKSVSLWSAQSGDVFGQNSGIDSSEHMPHQVYTCFSGPVLDVDWKNSTIFGAASDHYIYICKVGESAPLMVFDGHLAEVNSLRWDPTGSLLATGSDDKTGKIWCMTQDAPLLTLSGHTKDVYSVAWSPIRPSFLATASFDGTVRIWSALDGTSLLLFANHQFPVYTVCFSPDGLYLASGSYDKNIHIYRLSMTEQDSVFTISANTTRPDTIFQDTGGIYDLSWHPSGRILAAGSDSGNVQVIRLISSNGRSL